MSSEGSVAGPTGRRSTAPWRELASIVEFSEDAIYTVGLDDLVTTWNRGAERLYGYGAEEITGRSIEDLVAPRDRRGFRLARARVLEGGHESSFDALHLTREGRTVPISLTVSKIGTGHTTVGLAMIARDIADRARVERASRALLRELERKNAELERANADLSRFAYVASHDLSEPLRSISGFAQLVERRYGEAIDEEGQDYLHRIVAAAARLRNLIDALLAYSRTGRTELQVEQVDLNALLSEVVRSLAPLLDESGAVVDVADLPTVAGDASLLAQVFQNLISNAVKFRRDVPPRVRVRAEREDGRWRLHVADNGVGIEERHRERVFEIFSRLHAQGEYPGTGIGLAVVRAIAERHGGSAGMAPEQGGSDFWITIPIPEELDATESPGADTPGGGQLR